jgi:hypothetical protein
MPEIEDDALNAGVPYPDKGAPHPPLSTGREIANRLVEVLSGYAGDGKIHRISRADKYEGSDRGAWILHYEIPDGAE